jgi:(1->4)-alpha-D-glucan 1-alpha-D-glucosylmutase
MTHEEGIVAPGSTYRVQLHAEFGFDALAEIADYVASLGVTHVYCSPYLQATARSTHGYDVVDPLRLNSVLGGAPAHAHLVGALRDAGLGQVLDIVPNHMATDAANPWWWDVLENGPASRYADFFDIDWQGTDDKSAFTVLVPILGDHYGRVLEAGDLRLVGEGGAFVVQYGEHRLPISPRTLDHLIAGAARRAGSTELAELAEGFGTLPPSRMTDEAAVLERHARKDELADALERLRATDATVADAIDAEVDSINADPDLLDAMLRRQNYRLAHWRTSSEELDYRRFFSIETLVGLRVEAPDVFATTHALVLELVRDGTVEGLRIDHVDGLRDPEGYLAQLALATGGCYTVVEKILERDELLPESWRVAGTSGYEFLNRVNEAFVVSSNEAPMSDCYAAFVGGSTDYESVVEAAKQHVMDNELAAEVERLVVVFATVCDEHRRHRDHTRRELRDTLRELVASFDVYRTYVHPDRPVSAADRCRIERAVARATDRRPDLDGELLTFLGELALGAHQGSAEAEFTQRLPQLTAPVMAKGVEDTAFYRYNRFVSLNEVGGDPGLFGRSIDAFHEETAAAARSWPTSMLTLSTHDTKRSADVRARLNVLSELPAEWRRAVEHWSDINDRFRPAAGPDRNTEYLLYQTLVGAWPIEPDRVVGFMAKATREAKVHTSWIDPIVEYDEAVESFTRRILGDDEFVAALEQFLGAHDIVERGYRNSLAQVALLLTCPGVPDLYQGSEVWDASLVDPDNRRPVDYGGRRRLLATVGRASASEARSSMDTGAPKLWLVHRLLDHRRRSGRLYDTQEYEPIAIGGERAGDVIAFRRDRLAVVVPCRSAPGWADTTVELPTGQWADVTTAASVAGGRRSMAELLATFPVAVLERDGS